MNKNIKRISVYFNLDVPSDRKLYEYLVSQDGGKKVSQILKRTALENVSCETKSVIQQVKPKETKKKLHLSTEDKNNIEGMFG